MFHPPLHPNWLFDKTSLLKFWKKRVRYEIRDHTRIFLLKEGNMIIHHFIRLIIIIFFTLYFPSIPLHPNWQFDKTSLLRFQKKRVRYEMWLKKLFPDTNKDLVLAFSLGRYLSLTPKNISNFDNESMMYSNSYNFFFFWVTDSCKHEMNHLNFFERWMKSK